MCQLVETGATLVAAIEIRIVGNSELLGGADESIANGKRAFGHLHIEWSIGAVVVVGKALISFGPLEVGQDIAITPTFAACLVAP